MNNDQYFNYYSEKYIAKNINLSTVFIKNLLDNDEFRYKIIDLANNTISAEELDSALSEALKHENFYKRKSQN